jgi:hypothetical protein
MPDSNISVHPITPKPTWPSTVSSDFAKKCAARYRKNFQWKRPDCCAVCARRKRGLHMDPFDLTTIDATLPTFFNALSLASSHRHYDMNRLFHGELPERFKDLTWLEEQVCSLAHPGHNVFRLYFSEDPEQPYLAKGNCCVHPQPTKSTAHVLPLLPDEVPLPDTSTDLVPAETPQLTFGYCISEKKLFDPWNDSKANPPDVIQRRLFCCQDSPSSLLPEKRDNRQFDPCHLFACKTTCYPTSHMSRPFLLVYSLMPPIAWRCVFPIAYLRKTVASSFSLFASSCPIQKCTSIHSYI